MIISKRVTTIGASAFQGCSSIVSINIPDKLTSISERTFQDCTNMIFITIPSSVKEIGPLAFFNCKSLRVLPSLNNINIIGNYAFYGCYGLRFVKIPNSVTYIGEGAFQACVNLQSVSIASSVKEIGQMAFADCVELRKITVKPGSSLNIINLKTAFGNVIYQADIIGIDIHEVDLIRINNVNELIFQGEDCVCPICLGEFGQRPETIVDLACGVNMHHYLHEECFNKLCEEEGPIFCCPVCRKPYRI